MQNFIKNIFYNIYYIIEMNVDFDYDKNTLSILENLQKIL